MSLSCVAQNVDKRSRNYFKHSDIESGCEEEIMYSCLKEFICPQRCYAMRNYNMKQVGSRSHAVQNCVRELLITALSVYLVNGVITMPLGEQHQTCTEFQSLSV